jgi:hypothetical protein
MIRKGGKSSGAAMGWSETFLQTLKKQRRAVHQLRPRQRANAADQGRGFRQLLHVGQRHRFMKGLGTGRGGALDG